MVHLWVPLPYPGYEVNMTVMVLVLIQFEYPLCYSVLGSTVRVSLSLHTGKGDDACGLVEIFQTKLTFLDTERSNWTRAQQKLIIRQGCCGDERNWMAWAAYAGILRYKSKC